MPQIRRLGFGYVLHPPSSPRKRLHRETSIKSDTRSQSPNPCFSELDYVCTVRAPLALFHGGGWRIDIVGEGLAMAGFELVLAISDRDPKRACDLVEALRELRAAGMIIAPCGDSLPRAIAVLRQTPLRAAWRTQQELRRADDDTGRQAGCSPGGQPSGSTRAQADGVPWRRRRYRQPWQFHRPWSQPTPSRHRPRYGLCIRQAFGCRNSCRSWVSAIWTGSAAGDPA